MQLPPSLVCLLPVLDLSSVLRVINYSLEVDLLAKHRSNVRGLDGFGIFPIKHLIGIIL